MAGLGGEMEYAHGMVSVSHVLAAFFRVRKK